MVVLLTDDDMVDVVVVAVEMPLDIPMAVLAKMDAVAVVDCCCCGDGPL